MDLLATKRIRHKRCAAPKSAVLKERKMVKMNRYDYANMYGPTTGDAVRLVDTNLFAEVEHD